MANIKSAKKRIKITAKKTLRNKMIKSKTKTTIKKAVAAINAANKEDAQKLLVEAVSTIDRATQKGVYHKNNAARKKASIMKMFNKMA